MAVRRAVVGVKPSVKAGYEEAFSHMFLDQLCADGVINKKEYPIRPMLIKSEQFLGEIKSLWELDDSRFKRFLMERIKKVNFPQFVWSLQLHEYEQKRTECEIMGMILYDGINGKFTSFIH